MISLNSDRWEAEEGRLLPCCLCHKCAAFISNTAAHAEVLLSLKVAVTL